MPLRARFSSDSPAVEVLAGGSKPPFLILIAHSVLRIRKQKTHEPFVKTAYYSQHLIEFRIDKNGFAASDAKKSSLSKIIIYRNELHGLLTQPRVSHAAHGPVAQLGRKSDAFYTHEFP